jgi:hypothetical protein
MTIYTGRLADSLGAVNPIRLATLAVNEKPSDFDAFVRAQRLQILGEPAVTILQDLYYEFTVLGWLAGRGQIKDGLKAATVGVDWESWEPGNPEVARVLLGDADVPGLKQLLDKASITMAGIRDTRLRDLARVLARSAERGDSVQASAKAIREQFTGSRAWAKTVAQTEGRRAATAASLDSYRAAEIGFIRWSVAWGNACEICADYASMGAVPIDEGFGDTDGPPGHPNCLCVIVPVVLPDTELPPLPEPAEVEGQPTVASDEDMPELVPDADGFYKREDWPDWAKESDLGSILDELPTDRADIGIRVQSREELIREWEQSKSGYPDLSVIEEEAAKAEKQLPKDQKKLDDAQKRYDDYVKANPGLAERLDTTLMRDLYREYPELSQYEVDRNIAQRRVDAHQVNIDRRDTAVRRIAEAKELEPDWESTLVPRRIVDIDPDTGKPGDVLRGHMDSVKRAGQIVEDEVQRRLPQHLRDMPERVMSDEELVIVRDTRVKVISEVRPMDTGADIFRPLNDAEARATGSRGYGPYRGADQELIDLIQPSLDYYPSAWINEIRGDYPEIKIFSSARGYNQDGKIITVSGRGDRGISTLVHEVGHTAQKSIDGLRRLEWVELYDRSVKPTGKLPGLTSIYGSSKEKAFKDHRFAGRYTGKMYGKTSDVIYYLSRSETVPTWAPSFEVFTTGMQGAFPRIKDDTSYGDDDGSFQKTIMGMLIAL